MVALAAGEERGVGKPPPRAGLRPAGGAGARGCTKHRYIYIESTVGTFLFISIALNINKKHNKCNCKLNSSLKM